MLIEFLKPGTADLARRWLAALLLAPEAERASIVEAIERRMVEFYTPEGQAAHHPSRELRLHEPPVQRDGFVEQRIRTFEVADPLARVPVQAPPATRPKAQKRRG